MRDLFESEQVTIKIDELGKRIWVCVNGVTELRCGRIQNLEIQDNRYFPRPTALNGKCSACGGSGITSDDGITQPCLCIDR